jgi:uracil-DNA glycosylase family 4
MAINEKLCDGCPIQGEHQPANAVGPENAKFLVVVDVPSAAGAKEKRLLAPGTLKVFAEEMQEIGFGKDDFRFFPSCLCPYNPDSMTNKTKKAIHKHCRQHFVDEVFTNHPDALIPLGAAAATHAFGRDTKITKVRGLGNQSEEFHIPIFPLLSPAQVVFYPQNRPIFRADVQSFARFFDHGYDAASGSVEHGEYTFVDDLQFLIDMDPELLAFDTENTGLRWYAQGCDVRTYDAARHKGNQEFKPRAQILTMQFCVEPGKAYVLKWDHPEDPIPEARKAKLRNQIRQLLCKPERIIVGQNLKYDAVYLWKTEGIRIRVGGDTLMLATLLDENAMERNLDVLTKIHLPAYAGYADLFNATYDKSRMWEVPLHEIRGYGGGDADVCYQIYEILEAQVMQDERLWAHYLRVSLPGLNGFVGLEARGMHVDTGGAMEEFRQYMVTEVERQRVSIVAQIPRQIKLDHINLKAFKGKPEKALALSRPGLLKDILFTHPNGFKLKPKVFTKTTTKLPDHLKEPSVSSKDHLPFFFDTCPFTFELAEYVKNERLLTTNVVGFKNKYVVDDMVRPTYGLSKAVTGRTNSDDPNGQNYPKRGKMAKTYGKQFVAPPGYFMIAPDLSQAELRIAASMANEKTMIEIYKAGGDIHRTTAAVVMSIADAAFARLMEAVQKDARQKAKAVNFGFLFGMWWKKFIVYAKTQYGVEFTDKEAKAVRENFFKKYKGLEPWHNRVKDFALQHGYVRSYTGRIRHLPMVDSSEDYIVQEALRQAINSPVQECASSLGVMAIGRMNEEVDSRYLPIVGFIHDSIIGYVRKEYLDWGLKTIKGYMESNPMKEWFNSEIKVPIVADASFGLNFGELIECPGFRLDEPYNFQGLVDKEGRPLAQVPVQRTPPNNGRLTRSVYTLDTDLEEEMTDIMTTALARSRRVPRSSPRRAA